MSKAQYALDGIPGKDWKVSSIMGWRTHPVLKTRKHHNGTDIWGVGKGPHYIEAPYAGRVIKTKKSSGFGNYVILRHQIDGKMYTTLYAHLKDDSIKVKQGQKVEAGTVLGIMGTTGMSTGIHLHWELWVGKTHGWSADGKGFIEPISFFKAQIAKERALASAPKASPEDLDADAPVKKEKPYEGPVVVIGPVETLIVKKVEEPEPKAKVPVAKPVAKVKAIFYTVKSGDSYWAIAQKYLSKYGNGASTNGYVETLQRLNKNKSLHPGDKLRVK